jgi:hypothetical protein
MKAFAVAVLAASLAVTGCSTTRLHTPEEVQAGATTDIHAGDRAKLLLRSGERRTLKVSAIDSQTLSGREGSGASARSVQIALADVQSAKVRRGGGLRTAAIVVGVAVGVAVLAVGGAVIAQCGIKLNNCGD